MFQEKRRVVVTGLGAVTNVGLTVDAAWKALMAGHSGLGAITSFEQDGVWPVRIAGEVKDFDYSHLLSAREARRMDRFALLGLVAADQAAKDCGIDFSAGDPYRRGVVIGSGIGGIHTIEEGLDRLNRGPDRISPFVVPRLMVNACAGNVSIQFQLKGANSATSTACATGGHAIGTAYHMIQRGDAEIMFAGGSEAAITAFCIGSFAAMRALSTRNDEPQEASRPFDRDRDGFVLAEGAAVLILEDLQHATARGAHIYSEVLGFGSSCDAQHIAAPDEQGEGALKAMQFALEDGGIDPERIGYINAHGTSTPLGDAAEVKAVKRLFGDYARRLAISSTKSMTGHTLGAAGGIESVVTIKAVEDGVVPPTINLDQPDDGFDLDFAAHESQERKLDCALNNTFGFGGHNVSLVFGRYSS